VEGMGHDDGIGCNYLNADIGFGGFCLRKYLSAIAKKANDVRSLMAWKIIFLKGTPAIPAHTKWPESVALLAFCVLPFRHYATKLVAFLQAFH